MVRVEVRAHGLDEVSEEEHGGLAVDGEGGDGGVAERGEEGVPGRAGDGGRLRDDVGGVRERAELGEGSDEASAASTPSRAAAREDSSSARQCLPAEVLRSTAARWRSGGGGDDALQERANDRGIVRSRRHVTLSLGARGRVHARGAARTASARANGSPMPEEDGANGCGAGGERGRASRVDERSADTVPARRRRRVR